MKTNFIYAFRNIRNNSTNSLITVFGLAVAIACSLIIFLYVSQEYSCDSFHENADRIYRINYTCHYIDFVDKDVRVEPEIVERLKKEVPQIDKCTEYRSVFQNLLKFKENYYDIQVSFAGEDFFKMFSFKFLAGKPSNIFINPNEIVVTRKLAEKFGVTNKSYGDLLGKDIEFPLNLGETPLKIVGIVENVSQNSSINFDAVVSRKTARNFGGCDNGFGYSSVFFEVKENINKKDVEKNVNQLVSDYYKSRVIQMQGNNQMVKTSEAFTFRPSIKRTLSCR